LLAVGFIAATLEGLIQTCVRGHARDWWADTASMADLLARR
jgi:hypothetical protein